MPNGKRLLTVCACVLLAARALQSQPPQRVLIQDVRHSYAWSQLSKFASYLFEADGVTVDVMTPGQGFWKAVTAGPNLAGVMVESLDSEGVATIHEFVDRGGRALIQVDHDLLPLVGHIQEHFSLSFANRETGSGDKGLKEIRGAEYCPLFRGTTIAVPQYEGWPRGELYQSSPGMRLFPRGDGWVRTEASFGGEPGCMSAWRRMGKGEVLFLVSLWGYLSPEHFYIDRYIDRGGNKDAAISLGRWLAGKADYPAVTRR